MGRLWRWVSAFGKFWYGFIIGDDWAAAAGVLVMLGAAYGLLRVHVPAWWVGPVVIAATLVITLRRAARRQDARRQDASQQDTVRRPGQDVPAEPQPQAQSDQTFSLAGRRQAGGGQPR